MRRRDKAGGKAVKTQRRKALKRRNTAKIARRRKPSAADATEWIALLTSERDEALEQQAATFGGPQGHQLIARRPGACL
jgi:hypothetical protein